jgi:hypothetical protein
MEFEGVQLNTGVKVFPKLEFQAKVTKEIGFLERGLVTSGTNILIPKFGIAIEPFEKWAKLQPMLASRWGVTS